MAAAGFLHPNPSEASQHRQHTMQIYRLPVPHVASLTRLISSHTRPLTPFPPGVSPLRARVGAVIPEGQPGSSRGGGGQGVCAGGKPGHLQGSVHQAAGRL